MKVALLVEHLDPRRGGMERSASEFLAEIRALGIDAKVLTQTAAAGFSGGPVEILGVHGRTRARQYGRFVASAHQALANAPVDVVHAITPCLACDLYQPRSAVMDESLARTIAVRRTGLGRVVRRFAAVFDAKFQLLRALERRLLTESLPPFVAALSSYMRRQVESAYSIPSERMFEVFNGVTVPLPNLEERSVIRARLRKELGLSEETPAALFAGHNFRRKGLVHALEALARPAAGQWQLLVAGKDRFDSYARYARRLGIADRTRFLGSRQEAWRLYLAADVCVLPSYYDPCSRTILEALSLGLPCIATRFDGSADAIRNGEHGFVVDAPDAIDQIADALARLLPPAVRAKMSGHALKLRPYLSMQRHARQVAEIYEKVCGGSKSAVGETSRCRTVKG